MPIFSSRYNRHLSTQLKFNAEMMNVLVRRKSLPLCRQTPDMKDTASDNRNLEIAEAKSKDCQLFRLQVSFLTMANGHTGILWLRLSLKGREGSKPAGMAET